MNQLVRAINLARHDRLVGGHISSTELDIETEHGARQRRRREEVEALARQAAEGQLQTTVDRLNAEIKVLNRVIVDYGTKLNFANAKISALAGEIATQRLNKASDEQKPAEVAIGIPHQKIKAIVLATSERTGVSINGIMSRRQVPKIARARMIVYFLAADLTTQSMTSIGKRLGRDHSTILHGVFRIKEALAGGDPSLTADISAIKTALGVKEEA